MNYELHIGKVYDVDTMTEITKQVIILNEDQVKAIEYFADTEKDEDLRITFKINNCRFKIIPHFSNSEAKVKTL